MAKAFEKNCNYFLWLDRFDSFGCQIKGFDHFLKISLGLIALSKTLAYLLLKIDSLDYFKVSLYSIFMPPLTLDLMMESLSAFFFLLLKIWLAL